MKAVATAIIVGVLLASSVSLTAVGEVRAEEQVLQQHQVKIDGMT